MPSPSWKCRVSCLIVPPASRTAAWRWISYVTARSTERSELTFLVSVRVPHGSPGAANDRLASQRSDPSSMRTSETPSERMMSRKVAT